MFGEIHNEQKLMHTKIVQQRRQEQASRKNKGGKLDSVDNILSSAVIMNQSRRRPGRRMDRRNVPNDSFKSDFRPQSHWFKSEPTKKNRKFDHDNDNDDYDFQF